MNLYECAAGFLASSPAHGRVVALAETRLEVGISDTDMTRWSLHPCMTLQSQINSSEHKQKKDCPSWPNSFAASRVSCANPSSCAYRRFPVVSAGAVKAEAKQLPAGQEHHWGSGFVVRPSPPPEASIKQYVYRLIGRNDVRGQKTGQ